ncbi:unnamed protein product, partial [Hymenolepis diminuta]|uniref:J domain-containing protein n=1 Tax=Hymenolepis diminuta TaxID=6216 RepID=A0A0R3SDV9_HYMDI
VCFSHNLSPISRRFFALNTKNLSQLERDCWSCLKRINCKTFICECGKIQSVSPHISYFELFNFPPSMNINLREMSRQKRTLLQAFHPDKFVRASAEEKRISKLATSFINDACKVLADPISRAEYILTLNGSECSSKSVPITDTLFLNEILEVNEQVDEVLEWIKHDVSNDKIQGRIDDLHQSITTQWDSELDNVTRFLDKEDWKSAQESLAKLRYYERLKQRLKDLIPELTRRGLSVPHDHTRNTL